MGNRGRKFWLSMIVIVSLVLTLIVLGGCRQEGADDGRSIPAEGGSGSGTEGSERSVEDADKKDTDVNHYLDRGSLEDEIILASGSIDDLEIELVNQGILGEGQWFELDKDTYYDKTLAGMIGQVAGVLTGYEFIKVPHPANQRIGAPVSILEDLTYGPYGGGYHYNGMDGLVGSVGINRLFDEGRVASDDDYYMDIFNQLVFQENQEAFTLLLEEGFVEGEALDGVYQGIKSSWLKHQVSDWGGGDRAMYLMAKYPDDPKYAPPYTGQWESGNVFNWCTEAYIENETVGMNFPGMPQSASKLGRVMGSVTGDGESLLLAEFRTALYANAYVYDDMVTLMRDTAKAFLPESTWLGKTVEICEDLYELYPDETPLNDDENTGWRQAARAFAKVTRDYYDIDDLGCKADLNFGLAYLAVLYGQNDFETTSRISAVMGGDSDCYTAGLMGAMGIMVGMDGLPQVILDRIYAEGEGVYINDFTFTPHINQDYPEEQKWTDIALDFQENTETFIKALGGIVEEDKYLIPGEDNLGRSIINPSNVDFERGSLEGWSGEEDQGVYILAETGGEYNPNDGGSYVKTLAKTGDYRGSVFITEDGQEGRLYRKISGLEVGKTYKASAFVTGENSQVEFYINDGISLCTELVKAEENPNIFDGYWGVSTGWYYREISFTASTEEVEIGIKVRSNNE